MPSSSITLVALLGSPISGIR